MNKKCFLFILILLLVGVGCVSSAPTAPTASKSIVPSTATHTPPPVPIPTPKSTTTPLEKRLLCNNLKTEILNSIEKFNKGQMALAVSGEEYAQLVFKEIFYSALMDSCLVVRDLVKFQVGNDGHVAIIGNIWQLRDAISDEPIADQTVNPPPHCQKNLENCEEYVRQPVQFIKGIIPQRRQREPASEVTSA